MEGCLERPQSLKRGIGARTFVHLKRNFLPLGFRSVGSGEADGDGHGLIGKLAGGNRGQRFLMAAQGEGVALVTRDAEAFGDAFGGKSHAEISVGIMIDEPGIGGNFVAAHGDHGHGLGSACHHDFGAAGHNALRRHGNCLQAGGAETIDGHRRDLDRKSGAKGSDAGDIHSLFAFGHGAAEDDVLNFFGIELGEAIKRAFDGDGGQFIGASGAEGSLVGAADGSADGGNYEDFTHGSILLRLRTSDGGGEVCPTLQTSERQSRRSARSCATGVSCGSGSRHLDRAH